jgi:predicted ATPase
MRRSPSTSAPFLKRISLPSGKGSGYPYDLPIFKGGFELQFTSPVTILAGENGTGKSTLIESIAAHCGFNLSGGSRNHVYSEKGAVLSEFAPITSSTKVFHMVDPRPSRVILIDVRNIAYIIKTSKSHPGILPKGHK